MTQCLANCTNLVYKGQLQSSQNSIVGNTLDCRIWHTATAATQSDVSLIAEHCGHGAYNPIPSDPTDPKTAFCINSASALGAPLALVALLAIFALFM
jgi:hypothetical protein